MAVSRFSRQVTYKPPSGRKGSEKTVLQLAGLDMTNPIDMLKDGRTPFAENFRLYAQQSDSRQVAVSTRKGPGEYIKPFGETSSLSNMGATDESFVQVGVIEGQHLQPFSGVSGRLTRLDMNIRKGTSKTPILVTIYEDEDGLPGAPIAESSYMNLSTVEQVVSARFIDAPMLEMSETYWIGLHQQDDGDGHAEFATNSTGVYAWSTNATLSAITERDYSLQFELFTSPDKRFKGDYRFNRDFAVNRTVVALDESLYYIDEATNGYKLITTGLSPSATEYSFTDADGKVFWANGNDDLRAWNGEPIDTASNVVTNPDFETNTTGWAATGGGTGAAIARNTSEFHSGVASLMVTATSGTRAAQTPISLTKGEEALVSVWVKGAAGTNVNLHFAGPNINTPVVTMDGTWQEITLYVAEQTPVNALRVVGSGTFYLDDVSVKKTGVEVIKDTELPILRYITFHKDIIFGTVASDPNKFVYSDKPGNPVYREGSGGKTPTTKDEQWYYSWKSTYYDYAPRPFAGSPIVGLYSFQDSLTIFTQDKKYIYSGADIGSFYLRESTGSKGALSNRGITVDENLIWFVGEDGFYVFDGSKDTKISKEINPLFQQCGQKGMISPIVWENHVRWYMASAGSPYNDMCAIYSKDFKEWGLDTETYVDSAIIYHDADDNNELVEMSSLTPTLYYGEQGYHSLGKPIDFEYRMTYDSMDGPAKRKKIKRFYPIFQGVDNTFPVDISMDKDFEDAPKEKQQLLEVNGATWGNFDWDDGTLWGGNSSFKPRKQSFSGYARYWQPRVKRKAVNNRVAFIGIQFLYKEKRL